MKERDEDEWPRLGWKSKRALEYFGKTSLVSGFARQYSRYLRDGEAEEIVRELIRHGLMRGYNNDGGDSPVWAKTTNDGGWYLRLCPINRWDITGLEPCELNGRAWDRLRGLWRRVKGIFHRRHL